MALTQKQIAFWEAERQKHIDELNAISAKASEVAKQYEKLVNDEIEAIDNINNLINQTY